MVTDLSQQPIAPPAETASTGAASADDAAFGQLLAEAVTLLQSLPRHRGQVTEARAAVDDWSAAHPAAGAVLVVDDPPGQVLVGYDLLLDLPDGGTVALNAQVDDGVPWAVDHATHWAAGVVLTIDDEHRLSVPDALLALRSAGRRHPALLTQLIDHLLLQQAVMTAPVPETATGEDVQLAADTYRRRLGLLSAEDTHAWLTQIGMSQKSFDTHVTQLAFATRFRERLEARLGPAYLAAHPDEFCVARAVWVRCSSPTVAEGLAAADPSELLAAALALAESGELVEGASATGRTEDLPEALQEAPVGCVIGPVAADGRALVGAVLERRPLPPGPELDAAAGRAAFAAWMRERRSAADIRWHWL